MLSIPQVFEIFKEDKGVVAIRLHAASSDMTIRLTMNQSQETQVMQPSIKDLTNRWPSRDTNQDLFRDHILANLLENLFRRN